MISMKKRHYISSEMADSEIQWGEGAAGGPRVNSEGIPTSERFNCRDFFF